VLRSAHIPLTSRGGVGRMPLTNESPPQELAADGLGARGWISHTRKTVPKIIHSPSVRQALSHNILRLSQSASGESRWAAIRPGRRSGHRTLSRLVSWSSGFGVEGHAA
jgi:hypothetical protein